MIQLNFVLFSFWLTIVPILCQIEQLSVTKIDPVTYKLKWNVVNASKVNIKRYRVQVTRERDSKIFNWPVNIESSGNTLSTIYDSSDTIDCANQCVNNVLCNLFIFDAGCQTLPGSNDEIGPNIIYGSIIENIKDEILVQHLPYNENYLFQISYYDMFNKAWTKYTSPVAIKDSIIIEAKHMMLNISTYNIKWKQIGTFEYPIAKYKMLVSTNGSTFQEIDLKDYFNQFNQFETIGSSSRNSYHVQTLYFEYIDDALPECRDSCVNDPRCLEYFLKYDEDEQHVICQFYNILDNQASMRCLTDEIQKCETIKNTANEYTFSQLKFSTLYKIKLQFTTVFGTYGESNIVEFLTDSIVASISTSYKNGSTEGNYMRLTCSVQTMPSGRLLNADIDWYINNVKLTDTLKKSMGIKLEPNTPNLLTVPKLSYKQNNGNYTCETKIENQRFISTPLELLVQFGPNLINKYINNSKLVHKVGDAIQLVCPLQGYQLVKPNYPEWSFKKGSLLGSDDVQLDIEKIEKESEFIRQSNLNINILSRNHNGTYICNAENSVNGEQQIKVDVIVQSRPHGIIFKKFKEYENTAIIEWSIEDTGELNLKCIEILVNKTSVLKNKTIHVITQCVELSLNLLKLSDEMKTGYRAKIRFNNSLGYSEYSNELIYPSSYEPVATPATQVIIDDLNKPDEGSQNKLLYQALIISIGALVFLATFIFAVSFYKRRKRVQKYQKYVRSTTTTTEMKIYNEPVVYNVYANQDDKNLSPNTSDNTYLQNTNIQAENEPYDSIFDADANTVENPYAIPTVK